MVLTIWFARAICDFDAAAIVLYVVEAFLYHFGQVLRQHFRGFCRVDGRSGFTSFRNLRKLAVQRIVNDLFVQSGGEA